MKSLIAMVAVLTIGGATARTEAAMILQLQEGANVVAVLDNGAGDANPAVGAITFIGAVGVFDFNVSTGLSKPILGSTDIAHMDLNSVNVSSESGGVLNITLLDTDFSPTGSGTLFGAVGGTTGGTVNFIGLKCEQGDNAECPGALLTLGPFTGGAFSGSTAVSHGSLDGYFMALFATIVHETAAVSSFDFELVNVPEPASMALLGLGLLGFGAAARRRKLAASR